VPFAYFGKLPSRGDFVRSVDQPRLVQTLDRWLSQGLETMSADLRWKEVYDRGPCTHFAFLAVHSPRAIAGHMAASADASGRRFPFVVAGTFEVGPALGFMARAPLALARPWARFEQATENARAVADAASVLNELTRHGFDIDPAPAAHDGAMQAFAERHSLASLQALLHDGGHAIDLRQALLALGLLLRPLLAGTDGPPPRKGLRLPLPADSAWRPLVATFWLDLVAPFLRRRDVEIALFMPRRAATAARTLIVGFSGGAASHLHAVLDAGAGNDLFVDLAPAGWVEEPVRCDPALTKLSSYLGQPQLSLRQAAATFREAFLGG